MERRRQLGGDIVTRWKEDDTPWSDRTVVEGMLSFRGRKPASFLASLGSG